MNTNSQRFNDMLLEIFLCVLVIFLIRFIRQDDPQPLLGVYSQPGKWFYLKKYAFYLLFVLRKFKHKQAEIQHGKDESFKKTKISGYGKGSHENIADMEWPQQLSSDPNAIDCAFFDGFNKDGAYTVCRVGRRHNRKAEVWLLLYIPGEGHFQHPSHPDSIVYNTDGNTFTVGGLTLSCIEPLRTWRVSFNGLLRRGICNDWKSKDQHETVHVKFTFIWQAYSNIFNFDTDIHANVISEAVARQPWSKEFFEKLKR
ncbi:unnamed protein product [Owenia fusiformis]|uniref:Uncharacterized protein n=1 Tax=Owenia fusiformis TaxID=6347 RepID=A0A8S4NBU5_OWEFU|nr:unnamed protein product [Owenia fusiformis]